MVLGLITCHQSVSGALIISPLEKIWKQNSVKVIAMLLKSNIMSKWQLEAILQLLQVVERSTSLKNFQKSTIQGPYQKSKLKAQNILTIINNFFQNTFSNLKPVGEPARHIQRSLHCECNIFATMAGITKWLGNTIHRIQQRPVINCHF